MPFSSKICEIVLKLNRRLGHDAGKHVSTVGWLAVKHKDNLQGTAVRLKVEENQLVGIVGKIGVGIDGVKGL